MKYIFVVEFNYYNKLLILYSIFIYYFFKFLNKKMLYKFYRFFIIKPICEYVITFPFQNNTFTYLISNKICCWYNIHTENDYTIGIMYLNI